MKYLWLLLFTSVVMAYPAYTYINRDGTIGASYGTVMAANAGRTDCYVQNPNATNDMTIRIGGASGGHVLLQHGGGFWNCANSVDPPGQIIEISGTNGDTFYAMEW